MKTSLPALKKGKVLWLTGNTGAGKTTMLHLLSLMVPGLVQLDGDELRSIYPAELTMDSRREHNIRVAKLAKMLSYQGHPVVVAVICPTQELRREVQKITDCRFIYVKGGAANCEETPYEVPAYNRVTMTTSKEMFEDGSVMHQLKVIRGWLSGELDHLVEW